MAIPGVATALGMAAMMPLLPYVMVGILGFMLLIESAHRCINRSASQRPGRSAGSGKDNLFSNNIQGPSDHVSSGDGFLSPHADTENPIHSFSGPLEVEQEGGSPNKKEDGTIIARSKKR